MLKKMKLTTKLLGSFLVVLVIMVIVGVVGYRAMMGVAGRADKMGDVNAIVQAMLDTRQQEKNFMIRKDEESLKKQAENIAKLFELVKTTTGKFTDQANRDQMAAIESDAKTYQAAFLEYVDLEKKRNQTMEEIRGLGHTIEGEIAKLETSQKEQLAKDQKWAADQLSDYIKTATDPISAMQIARIQKESEEKVNDRIVKIHDAMEMVALLIDARKNEKEFIISGGNKEWKEKQDASIIRLKEIASSLKGRFKQQANIEQAETILASATAYDDTFDQGYAELMAKQKVDEAKMVEVARNAQKSCGEALADQKAKMQSQIASAVTLIVTTCIIAFIIGMALALLITRGITGPVARL